MDLYQLVFAVLSTTGVLGLFFAFVEPHLSGSIRGERRQTRLAGAGPSKRGSDRAADATARRKQITESLKELETRGRKQKTVTLEMKLLQAGLSWSRRRYYLFCGVGGCLSGALVFVLSGNWLVLAPAIGIGAFGLPMWILGFLRKRRLKKFVAEFPNAIDVIIRGVKAGLPLGDCLRVIAAEALEPVKTEFRLICEAQSVGLSIGESVDRIIDRVPVVEANFFAIVISIQEKAGGNLSEALGNLSKVLRERKKMKMKIVAMSSEAKSSAGIIGALPFLVGGMVYFTSPHYIELLWLTMVGKLVLGGCAIWMTLGVLVMKKMISFEF